MAFEIPQALKYEEKVVGPLTFRQFVSLGIPGLAVLALFKSELPLPYKLVPAVFLLLLGAGFAFLGLDRRALTLLSYYRHPRKLGYSDPRMNNIVFVKDIRKDTIFLRDGQKRAVLQLKPINFMIKSEADKSAIIVSFQRFLNSLTFPVQILIRTVNMDLDSYLEGLKENAGKKLGKERREKIQKLFDDYCEFLKRYIQENAVKNRLFYLVVPAPASKLSGGEGEKRELEQLKIRVQLCKEGLAAMGISSEQLTTSRLTSLLTSFYEGYVEVENDYLFPVTILKKFEGARNEKALA